MEKMLPLRSIGAKSKEVATCGNLFRYIDSSVCGLRGYNGMYIKLPGLRISIIMN